jgi:hypothetical protein
MPYTATDTCCNCGKVIDVRDFKSYRVRDDYRLMCVDCAKAEPIARAPEKQRKRPLDKKEG